ncbi:NUDIX domain-containing protein [Vibrio rotiferianus]|uniref:NUDIX domain-containing protein n=1 Tax=Vibrio rotiferianus TaxID=190895 RepID=UPI00148D213B|nr:NUDIX domain-containing protein [Vibrio rotiferianus]NOH67172.1 NUDIX domain-containing protein [Vibrio rotiferianus]
MKQQRAGVVLINRNFQLLLIERNNDGRNYHVFPGGSVESDESIVEAAKREALEETSIVLDLLEHVFEIRNQARIEHYFLSYVDNPTVRLGCGPEQQRRSDTNQYKLKWVGYEEIAPLSLYPIEAKRFCLRNKEWFGGR